MPKIATWHLPAADADTQPYWDAAESQTLLIKHCRSCDRPFFYPRPFCPRCWSSDVEWRPAVGTGRVYTFTIVRQNDLPPFKDRLPYVVAIIQLDEDVRMTSNVEGCAPEDVRCDMRVRVSFRREERDGSSVSIPVFAPA